MLELNPMTNPNQPLIFDRALVRQHRDRAAARWDQHRVLCDEMADRILERVGDVTRKFTSILDLGARDGALGRHLGTLYGTQPVLTDLSPVFAAQASSSAPIVDEEYLPFDPHSFDLIVSNLNLHWVNDLPGALAQIKTVLKPDGLFLATLFGGHSLHELRVSLIEAELALRGGASPRLAPSIDLPTASALLQRAGFALPVTDVESVTLTYPDLVALMRDLRGMGETNASLQRPRRFTPRPLFLEAEKIYRSRFGTANGRIPASFEIIFLSGWAS